MKISREKKMHEKIIDKYVCTKIASFWSGCFADCGGTIGNVCRNECFVTVLIYCRVGSFVMGELVSFFLRIMLFEYMQKENGGT